MSFPKICRTFMSFPLAISVCFALSACGQNILGDEAVDQFVVTAALSGTTAQASFRKNEFFSFDEVLPSGVQCSACVSNVCTPLTFQLFYVSEGNGPLGSYVSTIQAAPGNKVSLSCNKNAEKPVTEGTVTIPAPFTVSGPSGSVSLTSPIDFSWSPIDTTPMSVDVAYDCPNGGGGEPIPLDAASGHLQLQKYDFLFTPTAAAPCHVQLLFTRSIGDNIDQGVQQQTLSVDVTN